ncbi:MAG: beta-eliminating lyase-related protein [Coriobacteriia bacterium]|nr:beta-eliminating lyase-related protein [Coriobacteriia bacterium]
MSWRGFGSDNHSGAHPEVLAAMVAANEGHAHAYGDDPVTARAIAVLKRHLGDECDVAFTFNGTGANCVCLATVCRPWHSVICAQSAHINCDEAAAPERLAGVKLIPVATPDGKLTPHLVEPHLSTLGFEHAAQPRVISVSNVSEFGTVYSPDELSALADLAHAHGLLLHVDGARLANAAAALGCGLADITSKAGVDLLSLGGTKNGLVFGEAVVVFGDARTRDVVFTRKQLSQLASKMRFAAAQFEALFSGDLWLVSARHANSMATRLAEGARRAGVELSQQPQANEVFALLEHGRALTLAERFHFYTWRENARPGVDEVRWVTSWDTAAEDVDALVGALG